MNNLKKLTPFVLAILAGLFAVTVAWAASGGLDLAFDGDGRLLTDATSDANDNAYRIAVQADGRILAVGASYNLSNVIGDIVLIRYNSDGSLDTTFNGSGIVHTDLGGMDEGRDVIIQPDQKILVLGRTCDSTFANCDFALLRYTPSGQLDSTFNGSGFHIVAFSAENDGSYGGLAIQPDNKILAAGYVTNGASYDFSIYRFNPDGTLDSGFGTGGIVTIGFGAGTRDVASDLALQPDGNIVVSGYTCDTKGNHCDFALARLLPSGSLDASFSSDGKQSTDFGWSDDYAPAMALAPNGKIVLAGRRITATNTLMAVARYKSNGALDLTFNSTGKKSFSFLSGYKSGVSDLLVLPDGRILLAGYVSRNKNDFAIVRLKSGGALDTSFAGTGKKSVNFGYDDFAYGLALAVDGGYLIAGRVSDPNAQTNYFALAKLLP